MSTPTVIALRRQHTRKLRAKLKAVESLERAIAQGRCTVEAACRGIPIAHQARSQWLSGKTLPTTNTAARIMAYLATLKAH